MAINAAEAAQNMIAYTVVEDKGSLKSLLERNGVQMPSNCSDKEITVATLTASAKSPNFKNELAKLLTKKVKKANEDFANFVGDSTDFGFTGIDDFSFTGIEGFVGAPANEKAAARKAARKWRRSIFRF